MIVTFYFYNIYNILLKVSILLNFRAQREINLKANLKSGAKIDDKEYKGMNQYIDFRAGFRRENDVGNEKATGSHGPLRASTNVRTTIQIDY